MKKLDVKFVPQYCFSYEHYDEDFSEEELVIEIFEEGEGNINDLIDCVASQMSDNGILIEDMKKNENCPNLFIGGGYLWVKYGKKNIFNRGLDVDNINEIEYMEDLVSQKEIYDMIKKSKYYKPEKIKKTKERRRAKQKEDRKIRLEKQIERAKILMKDAEKELERLK